VDANGNVGVNIIGSTWNTTTFTGTTTFGGGFGLTGATMTAAGALSMDSNLVVTGTSTLTGTVTFGAGYASTGATITGSSGNIQTKGTLTVDSTAQITGNLTVGSSKAVITATTGLITLDGGATYPALKCTGAGSTYAGGGAGTAYTAGTPAFAVNQAALRVYIGNSIYRIPVWTDG
jgi:cytoskeletal protein CcmA (bactofilin family)